MVLRIGASYKMWFLFKLFIPPCFYVFSVTYHVEEYEYLIRGTNTDVYSFRLGFDTYATNYKTECMSLTPSLPLLLSPFS